MAPSPDRSRRHRAGVPLRHSPRAHLDAEVIGPNVSVALVLLAADADPTCVVITSRVRCQISRSGSSLRCTSTSTAGRIFTRGRASRSRPWRSRDWSFAGSSRAPAYAWCSIGPSFTAPSCSRTGTEPDAVSRSSRSPRWSCAAVGGATAGAGGLLRGCSPRSSDAVVADGEEHVGAVRDDDRLLADARQHLPLGPGLAFGRVGLLGEEAIHGPRHRVGLDVRDRKAQRDSGRHASTGSEDPRHSVSPTSPGGGGLLAVIFAPHHRCQFVGGQCVAHVGFVVNWPPSAVSETPTNSSPAIAIRVDRVVMCMRSASPYNQRAASSAATARDARFAARRRRRSSPGSSPRREST